MASTVTAGWIQTTAGIATHREVGEGHFWLDLRMSAEVLVPAPGQFVQLVIPGGPAFLPRPMSIAAAGVRRGTLTLGFLYAAVGSGTRALSAMRPGARLEVLGPLGRGFPLGDDGAPVLLAGGRGVAPLLFAAERLAASGRRCDLVFGARTRALLVGLPEARARLAKARGRLHLCTDDGSQGSRGTVLDVLARLAPGLGARPVIHACGPHGMLKAAALWAMAHDARAWLAMESPMACGTGVCRGCPLPRSAAKRAAFRAEVTPSLHGNAEYAMCCTEGPVFESRDLDWDRIA
jgi:dihydroorotate dehydrogenase electron transfer subunit